MTSTPRSVLPVLGTFVLLLLPAAAPAQPRVGARDVQPPKATLAIVGGMLIDGHEGPPLHHSIVLIDGNKIVAVGTRDTLTVPAGTKVIDAGGMTVMPGLIDAHVHHDILGHADYARWSKLYESRYADIIAISAKLMIMSGVTTAIDVFGPPDALTAVRQRVDRGDIPGPRMKVSMGVIINSSRGYVGRDAFSFQAKTVEEARATAQRLIGLGADIINAMDGLSSDQLKAIAEEARKKNIKVTGIAANPDDLIMRLRSGQQALDHMNSLSAPNAKLDASAVKALFDARASVVPTLNQSIGTQLNAIEMPEMYVNNPRMKALVPADIWSEIRDSLEHPERLPYFGQGAKMREDRDQAVRFKELWDSGVRVRVGTDTGSTQQLPTEAMWQEMELMVKYGAPPMEVISAATRRNAEWLNMADSLGTVTPGKLADVIVVDGNPLAAMRDLRHVVAVVKNGNVMKGATGDAPVQRSSARQ
jgi:imidazolonepropionase-like amidohydrolase